MTAPILEMHHGIAVVRDDPFPGGTKARFIAQVFDGLQEAVYASPPEGGAQTAIATVARRLGKRATIFVATQLVAAERTGQRCCAAELDPVYCDVAVRRWEMATGRKASQIGGQDEAQTQSRRGQKPA